MHVRPGDAFYLPDGWWHLIRSHGRNIAIAIEFEPVLALSLTLHLSPSPLTLSPHPQPSTLTFALTLAIALPHTLHPPPTTRHPSPSPLTAHPSPTTLHPHLSPLTHHPSPSPSPRCTMTGSSGPPPSRSATNGPVSSGRSKSSSSMRCESGTSLAYPRKRRASPSLVRSAHRAATRSPRSRGWGGSTSTLRSRQCQSPRSRGWGGSTSTLRSRQCQSPRSRGWGGSTSTLSLRQCQVLRGRDH